MEGNIVPGLPIGRGSFKRGSVTPHQKWGQQVGAAMVDNEEFLCDDVSTLCGL